MLEMERIVLSVLISLCVIQEASASCWWNLFTSPGTVKEIDIQKYLGRWYQVCGAYLIKENHYLTEKMSFFVPMDVIHNFLCQIITPLMYMYFP